MKQYLQAYKDRSVQIRTLSMPPESLGSDPKQLYQQFVENYSSIKELLQENRTMLDHQVYHLLKQLPDVEEHDADRLMDFPIVWQTPALWRWWTHGWPGSLPHPWSPITKSSWTPIGI